MSSHICRTTMSLNGWLEGSTKTNKLKGNTHKQHLNICTLCSMKGQTPVALRNTTVRIHRIGLTLTQLPSETMLTWLLLLFLQFVRFDKASVLPFKFSWCHQDKKTGMFYYSDLKMDMINALFFSVVNVCSHLCTNSSAGEGLGGTGGAFVISTWAGVWFGAWSGTLSSTESFEGSGCFRFSAPKWTESKAVFVRGGVKGGPLCGEEEVDGGEPVVLVWRSR